MIPTILEMILTLAMLSITTVCALSIVFRYAQKARLLTKIFLSFALGYVVISVAGILAALIGIDPIILQGIMVMIGAGLSLRDMNRIACGWRQQLDREDWLVIGIGSLYLIILFLIFDHIIMWMGGDSVAHASIIRMLLDGQNVPVSIPPLGSYWEYYPKGFHYYSYPWARVFSILDIIRAAPILLTAVTPALLYSIAREMGRIDEAIYAFILACFVFPAHYSYLIWAGYPTAAAEMLLVASVLVILVEVRLLPILLLGILFTHARLLVLACGVLFVWLVATRLRNYIPHFLAAFAVAILVTSLVLSVHKPEFLLSVFASQDLASEYAARWYPAFLSLFGAVIAITRRDHLDRLALSWVIAVVVMVLLADTGPLRFVASADRILLGLYLPLSLLAAVALSRMDGCALKIRAGFMAILLLSGTAAMGAVFYSYAGSWAIPQDDYNAIMWLEKQNYSDAICIDLDETGSWVYPLTGIEITNPRMGPVTESFYLDPIIADPGSQLAINSIVSLGHPRYLIYISSISVSRPGYQPPFGEFNRIYPSVNLSYPEDRYDWIYRNGAYIFGFPKGAFSISGI